MKNLLETSTLMCMSFALVLTACGGDDANDDEVGDTTTGDTTGDTTTDDTTTDSTTTDSTMDTTTADTSTTDATDTAGDMGMIRLLHLGVFPNDANTSVDIFANGAPTGVTFEFKQGTPYVELPAGTYTFDVVPSGGTIDDSVFTVADFPLGAGEVWSAYAAGYVAPEAGNAGFSVAAFQDDADGIPAGNLRLNVVHAAALGALDPVDVWVVDAECAPVSPLLVDFAYGDIAANVDIPAGAINIGFDVGQDATVDACFTVPDLGGDILVDAYAVNDSQGNVSIIAHLPDGSVAELTPN